MKQTNSNTYTLIDSGNGRKLEQFGPYTLSRPCSQAVWEYSLQQTEWDKADAIFQREGDVKWNFLNSKVKNPWTIEVAGLHFKINPTDFGHLGIFPEQKSIWEWIQLTLAWAKPARKTAIHLLNLFAYSGGVTMAAGMSGAHVCHLDASKGMVDWARENAALNKLQDAPIRWIVDDVKKFLAREIRRGNRYDAIILDPPTFGRGSKGELFKIEEHIRGILRQCRELLSNDPLFVILSCHTPGFTATVLHHLLLQMMEGVQGNIEKGEMLLTGSPQTLAIPSGTFARWTAA